MARSRARHTALKRPSTAVTAFLSFSALVAVSVAMSNGTAPAPWESAYANDSSQDRGSRGAFGQTGPEGQAGPSLFAAMPDAALISDVRGTPHEYVASQVRNVSDRGAGTAPSSVAPTKRAPELFEGELPFNTIIAPAQPVTVLDGGRFGWRIAPDTKEREFHLGTDISTDEGTPVASALDGTVTAIFWDEWGGNRVEVSHADGVKTTYNHLKDVMVREGDPLKASEQLGTIGQTGLRVTGPHLHFETWVEGKPVDPQSFDWETGEGIIPASRPKYSLEDQARTDQAVSDHGMAPGTDNGPMSEVPLDSFGEVIALGRETAPVQGGRTGGAAERGSDNGSRNTAGGSDRSASGERSSGTASGNGGEYRAPSNDSSAAQPNRSGGSSGGSGSSGRGNAGGTSNTGSGEAAAPRPNSGGPQGGSAADGATSGERTAKNGSTADRKSTGGGGGQSSPDTPAAGGKPTSGQGTTKNNSAKDQAAKDEAARDQSAQDAAGNGQNSGAESGAGGTDTPSSGTPATPAKPGTQPGGTAEPGKEKPARPGAQPGENSAPDGQKPAKPAPETAVDPYTAEITQLTTLEQLKQRTQFLLGQQMPLPPAQQFDPGSQLNAQLPLLSQQLVTAGVDKTDPEFTAQLTAAQSAVEKAAAAPGDKKLAAQATTELTKLQTMLADVPPFEGPAST